MKGRTRPRTRSYTAGDAVPGKRRGGVASATQPSAPPPAPLRLPPRPRPLAPPRLPSLAPPLAPPLFWPAAAPRSHLRSRTTQRTWPPVRTHAHTGAAGCCGARLKSRKALARPGKLAARERRLSEESEEIVALRSQSSYLRSSPLSPQRQVRAFPAPQPLGGSLSVELAGPRLRLRRP